MAAEFSKHGLSQNYVIVLRAEVCDRVLTKTTREHKTIITASAVYQGADRRHRVSAVAERDRTV